MKKSVYGPQRLRRRKVSNSTRDFDAKSDTGDCPNDYFPAALSKDSVLVKRKAGL